MPDQRTVIKIWVYKGFYQDLFSGKPMYFLSLPIEISWEPAFLHIVDTWLSKFSWLSISIPSNLTECSDGQNIFLFSIYISCLFSTFPNLFITRNLPGFTIIKLSINHWIAISTSFWIVSFNNMSFSKAVIVLLSAKLYNENFFIRSSLFYNKSARHERHKCDTNAT